ncbi:MAG: hypothetical protein IT340_12965 [Chloroflexi bacterium]|nr:hypothetical protein [Chloroflexota bacterium]
MAHDSGDRPAPPAIDELAADRWPRLSAGRQLARDLAAAAQRGEITDLEALARVVEHQAADVPPTLTGRWRFVVDVVALLTEVDLTRLPPRRGAYAPFGQRGFSAAYHSRDRASGNQVRHLVGYMPVGFLLGRLGGYPLSLTAEVAAAVLRGHAVDWPDVRLGWRGVELGAHLRSGVVTPAMAGRWLRRALGTDATAPLPAGTSHTDRSDW